MKETKIKSSLEEKLLSFLSHKIKKTSKFDADLIKELLQSLAQQGFLHDGWPSPYGNGDFETQLILHKTLARQPYGSIGLSILSHLDISARIIRVYGNDEHHRSWLDAALKGEKILSLAMTEPNAGSQLQDIRTSAKPDSDGWVLTGEKYGVTNLPFADAVITLCRTNSQKSPLAFSLFCVPTNLSGVKVNAPLETIGHQGMLGSVNFDNVKLGTQHLIGNIGQGLACILEHLDQERLLISARLIGMCEAMLKETLDHCKQRRTFGKTLISNQSIQYKLAELSAEKWAFDAQFDHVKKKLISNKFEKDLSRESALLKYNGTQLAWKIADNFMQLSGGHGYLSESSASQWFADIPSLSLAGGSNEVLLNIAARNYSKT